MKNLKNTHEQEQLGRGKKLSPTPAEKKTSLRKVTTTSDKAVGIQFVCLKFFATFVACGSLVGRSYPLSKAANHLRLWAATRRHQKSGRSLRLSSPLTRV